MLTPAFSLERTQGLLYALEDIIHHQRASDSDLSETEVILDLPLASRFKALYKEMRPFWGREGTVAWPEDEKRWHLIACRD